MERSDFNLHESERLPSRCIIYAGSYAPSKKELVRHMFDKWGAIEGYLVRFVYAQDHGRDYLVIFNVYGASATLEILHRLKEGQTQTVFFVGSMFAKALPVGTLVVPSEAVDKAGIVTIADPHIKVIHMDKICLHAIESELRNRELPFVETTVASVPCVSHGLRNIERFIQNSQQIAGAEMELSTFLYFSRMLGITAYALLYVSDNQRHRVSSRSAFVQETKREALREITRTALTLC